MKIAYLILAHKNPLQLERLVRRLDSKDSLFFIHIDKKVDITVFKDALSSFLKKVQFTPRENSRWGSLGIVKATIKAMEQIVRDNSIDYIILLSGQDYPIKNMDYIRDFLSRNPREYIRHYPFVKDGWVIERIERYHFNFLWRRTFPPMEDPTTLHGKLFNQILGLMFRLPRKFPKGLKPYNGTQWLNLTTDTARYVLDFIKKRPDYIKFHQYSFVPDEMFFQTIILNAPDKILNNVVDDDLRYCDWTKPGIHLPAIFKKEDLNEIKDSKKFFARKFDINIDSEIMDEIDALTNSLKERDYL